MISSSQHMQSADQYSVSTSRRLIWSIIFVFISFGIWSAYAPLDEVVRGNGRVVPRMHNQIVQNLEGGIIRDIFVSEGDVVDEGDLIISMDETQFQSAYQELQQQQLALLLRLARLDAEREGAETFNPDPSLEQKAPQYAASEVALFKARKIQLAASVSNLTKSLDLKRKELDILTPMLKSKAVSEVSVIQLKQQVVDIESKISEVKNTFENERSQFYSDMLFQLQQIDEKLHYREDQLSRTSVRSPVRGIVNKVMATTIGGVVGPGDPLVEILPLNEQLRIEGRISPRDIGFVFVDMPATVKLTAYDFSIYGTLKGHVVHVGADTVVDESQRDQQPYYEVIIELERTSLEGPQGAVEIRPGMQATLELASGTKTVLQYILKPLFKSTEALSER